MLLLDKIVLLPGKNPRLCCYLGRTRSMVELRNISSSLLSTHTCTRREFTFICTTHIQHFLAVVVI